MSDQTLYDRLGGVFAIAAVVDHFSDAIVRNPKVGARSPNPALREWHTQQLDRLPGLKFMRTLWVCDVAGGPLDYHGTRRGSRRARARGGAPPVADHPEEFDEVAAELGRTLDQFRIPSREKEEVLGAFAAHKGEVTEGATAVASV